MTYYISCKTVQKNVFDDAKEMEGLPRCNVVYEYMYVFIYSFIYSEVCF